MVKENCLQSFQIVAEHLLRVVVVAQEMLGKTTILNMYKKKF